MKINRNNYETFFLMYVDNELTPEERKEVDEFISSNPDLSMELEMFREVVLQPEPNIIFAGKETLLKGVNPVNENNYEEFFILYGDNELGKEEREFVEQFVLRNPQFQPEFELLLQARFEADHSIEYPNKESLYRYEKKGGMVIGMQWMRIAVAAVFLIFMGGFGWNYIYHRDAGQVAGTDVINTEKPSAGENDQKNNRVISETPAQTQLATEDIRQEERDNLSEEPRQVIAYASKKSSEKISSKSNIAQEPAVSDIKKEEMNKEAELLPEKAYTGIVKTIENKKMIIDEAISESQLRRMNQGAADSEELTQVPEPDDTVIYVSNDDKKKNVRRGFFRKASRLFERTTNIEPSENDQAINIAGFEIALK